MTRLNCGQERTGWYNSIGNCKGRDCRPREKKETRMREQRVVIRETAEMFGGMVEENLTRGIIELEVREHLNCGRASSLVDFSPQTISSSTDTEY